VSSNGSDVISADIPNNLNKTYPILVAAAIFARSLEEAEEAVCAWAEEVSRPDPARGVIAVNISLPADARPGTRTSWRWFWRRRFTFPLAGQITVVNQVVHGTQEGKGTGTPSPGQKEDWDALARRCAAHRGITVNLRWGDVALR
jgi:hypothetical protein